MSEELDAPPAHDGSAGHQQTIGGKLLAGVKAASGKEARWPAIVGAFFYLTAIAFEHAGQIWFPEPEHLPTGARDRFSSEFFSTGTIVALLTDLGSAFVVAWVVSVAIEAASRRRQEQLLKQSQEAIAEDVFHAVYRLKHDKNYVKAAIEGVLGTHFIREAFDVSYTIASIPKNQAQKLGIEQGRFVKLTVTSKYSIKNITPGREHFRMRYSIPVRGRTGPLSNFSKVKSLRIGDKDFKDAEIEGIREDSDSTDRCYLIEADIEGNDSLPVVIEAELIKEMSDTESLGLKLPTLRMTVRLAIQDLEGLEFDLRGYTSSLVKEDYRANDKLSATWVVEGPMLPWNSLVLWWRTPQDAGEPIEALPTASERALSLSGNKTTRAPSQIAADGKKRPSLRKGPILKTQTPKGP